MKSKLGYHLKFIIHLFYYFPLHNNNSVMSNSLNLIICSYLSDRSLTFQNLLLKFLLSALHLERLPVKSHDFIHDWLCQLAARRQINLLFI